MMITYSADEANLEQFGRVYLVVSFNGDVLWVPPAHFKAFCKLDLRYWPFDEQACGFFKFDTRVQEELPTCKVVNRHFAYLQNCLPPNYLPDKFAYPALARLYFFAYL